MAVQIVIQPERIGLPAIDDLSMAEDHTHDRKEGT
jgi:hypothetical protein